MQAVLGKRGHIVAGIWRCIRIAFAKHLLLAQHNASFSVPHVNVSKSTTACLGPATLMRSHLLQQDQQTCELNPPVVVAFEALRPCAAPSLQAASLC